jgi:acyl-CoA dehydrogenase
MTTEMATQIRRGRLEYPWHQPYRDIREAMAQLCATFPLEYWDQHEYEAQFPEEFYRAFADGGWLGTTVPEEYGGSGLPMIALAAVLEEVAASGGALDACSSVHIPMLSLPILLRFGTEAQRERFIGPIIRGELYVTFGVTEPNAGTDTTRIETTATRRGDKFIVDGQKVWNSGALRGDRVMLVVRTSPRSEERGRARGMSLLMVDLKAPGITITPIRKISRNAVASTEVFFDNVEVPVEDLIGTEDEGFYHLLAGLNGERLLISAESLGMGRWAVERAVSYASERVVFGRPIGANQSIQHPLADAYLQLLAASQVVATGLEAYQGGDDSDRMGMLANAAKYLSSEAAFKAADQGMQTLGGFSFAREYHMGRFWMESRLQRIAPVSNQLVLNFVAERVLGLPRSY